MWRARISRREGKRKWLTIRCWVEETSISRLPYMGKKIWPNFETEEILFCGEMRKNLDFLYARETFPALVIFKFSSQINLSLGKGSARGVFEFSWWQKDKIRGRGGGTAALNKLPFNFLIALPPPSPPSGGTVKALAGNCRVDGPWQTASNPFVNCAEFDLFFRKKLFFEKFKLRQVNCAEPLCILRRTPL